MTKHWPSDRLSRTVKYATRVYGDNLAGIKNDSLDGKKIDDFCVWTCVHKETIYKTSCGTKGWPENPSFENQFKPRCKKCGKAVKLECEM